jgi:hypothetical protein
MARRDDQLVAPVPSVTFVTDEAAAAVLNPLRSQHEQLCIYIAQQTTLAGQCRAQIEEMRHRIDQVDVEVRKHELAAQQGRNAARGVADMLGLAGVQVPPSDGELSHNPDAATARWSAAVDEQNAAEVRS